MTFKSFFKLGKKHKFFAMVILLSREKAVSFLSHIIYNFYYTITTIVMRRLNPEYSRY